MSRIGKKEIQVPSGVTVSVKDAVVSVKGPKGSLSQTLVKGITVARADDTVVVKRDADTPQSRANHGLIRALVANMVTGVTKGFEKNLEIVGVGYIGTIQGKQLQLRVGFANQIDVEIPAELDVTCPDQTHIVVQGCDKQLVGNFAASVRAVRKPEPYKGKGIRYQGEYVKIKPGKTAT